MRRVLLVLAGFTLVVAGLPYAAAAAAGAPTTQRSSTTPPGSFELVGHEPLGNRGMNAALAIHGNYAYVGSRTDGKPGSQNLTNGGIMIVDISNPAAPRVVGQVTTPDEGNSGESSRELRVWRSQGILIVLRTNCSSQIHWCTSASPANNFRAYDISGANATSPKLIRQWTPGTHEFFLWEDPFDPNRALIFNTPASGSSFSIFDISPLRTGGAPVQLRNGSHLMGGSAHSLSVSNDGKRAYFALLTGGFGMGDVSEFTSATPNPQYRPITGTRPTWDGPGAHSAVKVWGKEWVAVFDEVYGTAARALGPHGCPWGWGRLIDIADPARPQVRAEYKLAENQASYCQPVDPSPAASYSAHNPTFTPNVGLVTWHSGGLQAIDLSDPASPKQLAEFRPTPLPFVVTEDPMLSAGLDKIVMWSYPIVRDGLIYVVDVRNGLYILRYKGPFQDEVAEATFLEGNSNQGHALCYEPVLKPKEDPEEEDEYLIPEYCLPAEE